MKKYILTFSFCAAIFISKAQSPEDILKYSYFPQNGSARNLAVGGAMGSLGGDINALFVNPAGLGMYKTREFVFSPGFIRNDNKANFRGTTNSTNNTGFSLGPSGVVIGFNDRKSKWANQAFTIGFTQTANFNNRVTYSGYNDNSSYSEMFVEQMSQSGLSIDDAINNPQFAFGTAPALYTYLVDTFRNRNGDLVLRSQPEFLLDNNQALLQRKTVETSGGIYELGLGFSANMDDKLYLGGSLGIPFISYTRNTQFRESDTSGNTTNGFNFFEHTDRLNTSGVGANLKLGFIYKPKEYIRLGFALHTPTYFYMRDRQSADLTTDSENYAGVHTVKSGTFTNGAEGEINYSTTTPWKLLASGSYVFREVKDTRKQRAFITADIEYVGYGGSRYRADGEEATIEDKQYYRELKEVIKDYYKGAFNYRLGAELKFHTVMFRLGGAYYSNPYRESDRLKSSIKQLSGGIGYRDRGMFIDLTYVHTFTTDVNFPYRLTDKALTFAEQQLTRGNVMMTIGFKF